MSLTFLIQDLLSIEQNTLAIDWTTSSFIFNTYFDSLGLSATSYKAICCLACQMTFSPEEMLHHLKQHTNRHETINTEHYIDAIRLCNISPTLVTPPNDPLPCPLIGLPVQQGLGCNHCPWAGTTLASLQWHFSTAHRTLQSSLDPLPCHIQRFNNGNPSWFRVQEPCRDDFSVDSHREDTADLYAFLKNPIQAPDITNDPREITPWLRSTGWHLQVANHNAAGLCKLVATPGKDELAGLSNAILKYIQEGIHLIGSTDEIVLQRLNTEDPDKT